MREEFHFGPVSFKFKAGERYKTAFALEYWHILDSVESHPPLATFHNDCPDAEKMAKSLASWLNSGPEGTFLALDDRTNPKAIGRDGDAYKPEEA